MVALAIVFVVLVIVAAALYLRRQLCRLDGLERPSDGEYLGS